MSQHGQSSRIFWSLSKLFAVSLVVLMAVITIAFGYWLAHGMKQEITSVNRELSRSLQDVHRLLSYRTLSQLQGDEAKVTPLKPIPFDSHPSPFNRQDMLTFKEQYPLKTYYAPNDVKSLATILAGYSNVTLYNGGQGPQYLSILAWMKGVPLSLYDGTQGTSPTNSHLWLIYQGSDGKLQPIFIRMQALNPSEYEQKPGARVAEISGYLAKKLGVTSSLHLDRTLKGSVFKDSNGDGYLLSLRMRVNSLKKLPRPSIDLSRPIGLQFAMGKNVEGNQVSISTFSLAENHTLDDVPHMSGTSIQQALMSLPENIKTVTIYDPEKQPVSLLDRPLTPHAANDPIGQLLWKALKYLARKQLGVKTVAGDSFLLYRSRTFQQSSTNQDQATLQVSIDPHASFVNLIATQKSQIWLYCFAAVIIVGLHFVIYFYVIRRIKGLTEALFKFERGNCQVLDIDSQKVNDEIGLLSHFLQQTIKGIVQARLKAEERHKQHSAMMAIMGHDIRTPVAALLKLHEDDGDTLQYVKRIERASAAILEVANLESALLNNEDFEVIDACQFFEAVSNAPRNNYTGKIGVIPPKEQILIYTNAEILEDAVDGIVNNAVDYAEMISIRISRDDHHVVVEICNDGEPIDASIIDTLFEYGVSKRPNQCSKHHGIGLFSVAFRISILNGYIRAENRDNGVAFILQLPLAQE